VRQIDHDAEAVHLPNHFFAEGGEAAVACGIGGGVRPVGGGPMRQRDVSHAEIRERAQRAERALQGVPALDADQTRDPPRPEVALDLGHGTGRREGVGVARAHPVHERDLLEGVDRRMRARLHRAGRHVRRPELGADAARAQPRDVGVERRLAHGDIHRVEPAAPPDLAREIVVSVDERYGTQDAQGPVAVGVLGGGAIRTEGGEGEREQGEAARSSGE
jgi:hypothetical protein